VTTAPARGVVTRSVPVGIGQRSPRSGLERRGRTRRSGRSEPSGRRPAHAGTHRGRRSSSPRVDGFPPISSHWAISALAHRRRYGRNVDLAWCQGRQPRPRGTRRRVLGAKGPSHETPARGSDHVRSEDRCRAVRGTCSSASALRPTHQAYAPVLPSTPSRIRSACPQCWAYSVIIRSTSQRRSTSSCQSSGRAVSSRS
jgi:hypothetical protein